MIVIGVLLILIAVGATVFALIAPSGAEQTIEVTALGFKVSASPVGMFMAGAAAVVLLTFGFVLVSRGARRKASQRKELHQLRKEQAAAGAGANVPTAEGEVRSRRDRRRHGGSTDTGSTDTASTDTASTISSTGTGSTRSSTDTGSSDTGSTESSTDTGSTQTSPGTRSDPSR